jgi:hypothetical protein
VLSGGAVALLIAAVASAFWPGIPMYDTVSQYDQVLSGDVEDWHPPIMVRLWQVISPLGSGTAPMFALQVALYALGFALIVSALARDRRWAAAGAVAVLGLSPLLLGWQMVVLKDAQMLGALVFASGVIAHYRLRERRVPVVAAATVALLMIYATLVRANALFATVPMAVLLLPRPASMPVRGLLALIAMLALIAVEPVINHRVFGASPSGVAKSQPLFDLAAIAVAVPASVPPFTAGERRQLVEKNCVKAFFWDPIGEPSACGALTERADALPESQLYLDLAEAVIAHPLAYAEHRLAHWNSTERWLVQPGLIDAKPPDEAEPNDVGLATPSSPMVQDWQARAALQAASPLGWPIVWTAIAAMLLPAAWRRRFEPVGGLALALTVSALTLETSFLVISIASDLRYHLWSMTASALALILLSDDLRLKRSELIAACALLVLIAAGGVATRSTLAMAPDSYQAMLHAPSG